MTVPNPLIPGFNPDPSIVLADGAYYLVTSTFEYLPGIPVYRSTDLVSWRHIGNVATRPEQAGVADVATGGGVWAPTIRYHDDVFYVISGTMSVLVDAEWIDASPGSFVLVPGNVTHDFENRGSERAGVLNVSAPGTFEEHMPGIAQWFAEHPACDTRA